MEIVLAYVLLLACLLMLWYMCAFRYRSYRTDVLRQQLFGLRSELFEYAKTSGLGFDSKAYQHTRTGLNNMIRFAHKLSLIRVILFLLFAKKQEAAIAKDLRDMHGYFIEIPSEHSQKLKFIKATAFIFSLQYLVKTSPTLYLATKMLALLGKTAWVRKEIKRPRYQAALYKEADFSSKSWDLAHN